MLGNEAFHQLLNQLGTPEKGRALISRARGEAPVREVRSTGKNVLTAFASQKMQRGIMTESRKVEYVAAIEHEMNPEVLEYYPQPCQCKFEILDEATGEVIAIDHTPDFLVIENSVIRLQEWKTEARLQSLAQRQPYRWQKLDGRWRSPQIEAYFAEMGIAYEIHSADEIHPNKTKNWEILLEYFDESAPACSAAVVERLKLALREHGSLSLLDLLHAPFEFLADDLLKAIAEGHAACDLSSALLSTPGEFRLYRDQTLMAFEMLHADAQAFESSTFAVSLEPGTQFEFDGKTLELTIIGESELVFNVVGERTSHTLSRQWLLSAMSQGAVTSVGHSVSNSLAPLLVHSQAALEEARQKSHYLSLPYDKKRTPFSERTYYRLQAAQAAASANGGNEVLALAPQNYLKGNRQSKLTAGQQEAMEHVRRTVYLKSNAPIVKSVYQSLIIHCASMGVKAPSYPTFNAFIKANENNGTTRIRDGKRIAYQKDHFYYSLNYDTPRHGVRPFEQVHIDHTLVDVELKCRRTGRPLGRPWLTMMVDAFSRRVMAIHLGFHQPDRAAVLMCLRSFVQRWNRLPFMLVCDNGKDLIARDVENFVLTLGCHLRRRPAGQPRVGSVMERMFGTANTELFHNLDGNTKLTKQVRMLSGSHLPQKLANWGLDDLYKVIEFWAFQAYDQDHHPSLDMSPRDAFMKGLRETGSRPHKLIAFNKDFLIATCPSVNRGGERSVDRQRGIKVHNFYYQSPTFDSLQLHGASLPVRYDPNDIGRIFVKLPNHQWIEARSMQLQHLPRMNLRQLKAVSEEYKAVHKSISAWDAISGRQLLEFIATMKIDEKMATEFQLTGETEKLQEQLRLLDAGSTVPSKPRVFGVDAIKNEAASMVSGHLTTRPQVSQERVNKLAQVEQTKNGFIFGELE